MTNANHPATMPTKNETTTVTVSGRGETLALATFLADSGYTVSTSRIRALGGLVLPSDATLAERRVYDAAGRFEVTFYAAVQS